jgi:mannan endo-1,4-beta-mannosidase
MIVNESEARGKVAALSETGLEAVIDADWFTRVILNPIKGDPIARRIGYVLVWRNQSDTYHFAPYADHKAEKDFIEFFEDPYTLFGDTR